MKHLSRLLARSMIGAVLLTLVLVGTASAYTLTSQAVPGPQTLHGLAALPRTIPPLRSSFPVSGINIVNDYTHATVRGANYAPQFIVPGGGGANIVDYKSGLCIGIDSSDYAGDWTCTNNNDQLWGVGDCEGGFCQITNKNNQCLGVAGASDDEGARIRGWTCNGSFDQLWTLSDCTDDYYLVNDNSRLVIGVQGGSTANGAELVQWASNGNLDQCWNSSFF